MQVGSPLSSPYHEIWQATVTLGGGARVSLRWFSPMNSSAVNESPAFMMPGSYCFGLLFLSDILSVHTTPCPFEPLLTVFAESNHSALKVKRFGSLFISDCFWARVNAWIRYACAPESLFWWCPNFLIIGIALGLWEHKAERSRVNRKRKFIRHNVYRRKFRIGKPMKPKWNESGIVWTGL